MILHLILHLNAPLRLGCTVRFLGEKGCSPSADSNIKLISFFWSSSGNITRLKFSRLYHTFLIDHSGCQAHVAHFCAVKNTCKLQVVTYVSHSRGLILSHFYFFHMNFLVLTFKNCKNFYRKFIRKTQIFWRIVVFNLWKNKFLFHTIF